MQDPNVQQLGLEFGQGCCTYSEEYLHASCELFKFVAGLLLRRQARAMLLSFLSASYRRRKEEGAGLHWQRDEATH
jgi:hypothetical protein